MSSQLVTSNEGEGDFNFEAWISQNNLSEIKELFVKHGATTPKSLKITSDEFKSLMVDQSLFQKSHLIPIIMDAMQNVQSLNKDMETTGKIVKVIMTEEEQSVIDNIESNLKALHEIEQEINGLKENYPKSKLRIKSEKYKKIDDVTMKIDEIFKEIMDTMNMKKDSILKQVEDIKNNIDNNDDDEKEYDVFDECQENINDSRKYLSDKLSKCDILTSNNENKLKRKNEIINIGKEVNKKSDERNKILTNNINNINNSIKQNESRIIDIDFIVNDKKYKKIIDNINNIGCIINESFKSLSSMPKIKSHHDKYEDDDDAKIKELQNEVKLQNHKIKSLNLTLNGKKQRIKNLTLENEKALQSLIKCLSFTDNKCKWYETEEKKQDPVVAIGGEIKNKDNVIAFIDGTTKSHVVKKDVFETPRANDINDVNKYIKHLMLNSYTRLQKIDLWAGWNKIASNNEFIISGDLLKKKIDSDFISAFSQQSISKGSISWKVRVFHSDTMVGVIENERMNDGKMHFWKVFGGFAYYGKNGNCFKRGNGYNEVHRKYGKTYGVGDVITVNLNLKKCQLSFLNNDSNQGIIPWKMARNTQYHLAVALRKQNTKIQYEK